MSGNGHERRVGIVGTDIDLMAMPRIDSPKQPRVLDDDESIDPGMQHLSFDSEAMAPSNGQVSTGTPSDNPYRRAIRIEMPVRQPAGRPEDDQTSPSDGDLGLPNNSVAGVDPAPTFRDFIKDGTSRSGDGLRQIGEVIVEKVAQARNNRRKTGSEMTKHEENAGTDITKLGKLESLNIKYEGMVSDAQQKNKYAFLVDVRQSVNEQLKDRVTPTIEHGPLGSLITLVAQEESKGAFLNGKSDVSGPHGPVERVLHKKVPHMVEYRENERTKRVVEPASVTGVNRVLNPHFTPEQSVHAGFGGLGIKVHENTLRGTLQVDGLETVSLIDTILKQAGRRPSSMEGDKAASWVDGSKLIIKTHVETTEVERDGENCENFVATVLMRGDNGTRHVLTMTPGGVNAPGQPKRVDLDVEGVTIDRDLSEMAAEALADQIRQGVVVGDDGSRVVHSSMLDAKLVDVVTRICSPNAIGVPTSTLGRDAGKFDVPQTPVLAASSENSDTIDADIVDDQQDMLPLV